MHTSEVKSFKSHIKNYFILLLPEVTEAHLKYS